MCVKSQMIKIYKVSLGYGSMCKAARTVLSGTEEILDVSFYISVFEKEKH